MFAAAAFVAAAYAAWALLCTCRCEQAGKFPDTRLFFKTASAPVLSADLWAGPRPPAAPLFFKALGLRPRLIAVAQTALSIAAWCFLGIAVAAHSRRLVPGMFGMTAVLAYSLTDNRFLWHTVILSESLTLSCTAALLGSWLLYLGKRSAARAAAVTAAGVLFALVRDTNAYMLALLGAVLIAAEILRALTARKGARRLNMLIAAAYLAVFAVSVWSHSAGQRWVFPFYNLISQRVLTSAQSTHFFEKRGMPVNDALMSRAGKWAASDERLYYNSPELKEFRRWAHQSGRQTYISFLLASPGHLIKGPLRELQTMLTANFSGYAADDYRPALPGDVWYTIVSPNNIALVLFAVGLVFGALIFAPSAAPRPLAIAAVASVPLAAAHLLIAWHGDAMEVYRHCLPAVVQLHCGFLLALTAVADRMADRAARRRLGTHS